MTHHGTINRSGSRKPTAAKPAISRAPTASSQTPAAVLSFSPDLSSNLIHVDRKVKVRCVPGAYTLNRLGIAVVH
jgi:hypothetical protein